MNLPNLPSPVAPALTTPSAAARKDKIVHEAQEFEGILIGTLWSEFQNDPLAPKDGPSDPGAQSLKGLGLQAMSQALASRGGLGLATLIEHQLMPPPGTKPVSETELTKLKSTTAKADKLDVAKLAQFASWTKMDGLTPAPFNMEKPR